jgi:uncharacterized protein YecE (DUF72 family)
VILLGTSGFSYDDWCGPFYPRNLSKNQWLSFYANHFNTCEINMTYYRIPSLYQMQSMVDKSQGKLKFVLKLFQGMTHQRNAGPEDYKNWRVSLEPMQRHGMLGAVLIQFPFSFSNSLDHRAYLLDLQKNLALDGPLAIEFRHRSWFKPATFDFLREHDLSYVNVDEPEIPGLLPLSDEVTGPIGYVRFHGRNREKWFSKNAESWERYDYLYSESELESWVSRIRRIEQKTPATFVFFNNHWQSQAVTNAQQLQHLLENS